MTNETADGRAAGVAQGVDTDGALLLVAKGARRRITSGSVILSEQAGGQAGEHP